MHNNGSNRLILPQRGPVMGSMAQAQPQAGIRVEINAMGILLVAFAGETVIPFQFDPQSATQLGVNIISAVALGRAAAEQAAQAPKPALIVPEAIPEEHAESTDTTPDVDYEPAINPDTPPAA